MSAKVRFTLAASVVVLAGVALYACSEEETGGTGGAEAGADTANPDGGGGTDTGTDTNNNSDTGPKSCPLFESDAGRPLPEFGTKACGNCSIERCCTPITKCYGATPADAGTYDGSDGKKTVCKLYGECEGECAIRFAGDMNAQQICEVQCQQSHGAAAQTDWAGSEGCIFGAAPSGCSDFCQ